MPKLWEQSIDGHRRAVRDAITAAAWQLAEEQGPLSLTMSQVAKAAGIGRATLYKYFTDVESILIAHHTQHVEQHLAALEELRADSAPVGARLVSVIHGYGLICFHRGRHAATDVSTLVHRGDLVADADRRLREIFTALIAEAAEEGLVRTDTSPDQLATYCLHALTVTGQAADRDEVVRLVRLVLDGLGCALPLSAADEVAAVIGEHPPAHQRP